MEEIYKPIKDYEGLYEVSDFGNVRNCKTGYIFKGYDCDGYLKVGFCKDKKRKHFRIHRLVAEAFIPNPENKPEVEHRDCNRKNNHFTNLRWATRSENQMNIGLQSNNTTGFRGVTLQGNRYKAQIKLNGERIYLGYYDTAEKAHEVRRQKAMELFGEFINECEY